MTGALHKASLAVRRMGIETQQEYVATCTVIAMFATRRASRRKHVYCFT